MATVIDALVVELGLDPKKFTQGQREAVEAFKKTQSEAERVGKGIEAAGAQAAAFFSQLRNQVIGLFAAFTAGKGLKQFVADVTDADNETGKLSRRIGQSVETISKWQGAARLAGSTAADASGSFQGWTNQLQTMLATGQTSLIPYLRALAQASGKQIDLNKSANETFLDMSEGFEAVAKTRGPAYAGWLAQQMGLQQGFVDILLRGRKVNEGWLRDMERIGYATKADADAATERVSAWNKLILVSENLGRAILTKVTPVLIEAINWLTEFGVTGKENFGVVEVAVTSLTAAVALLTLGLGAAGLVGVLRAAAGGLRYLVVPALWALRLIAIGIGVVFGTTAGLIAAAIAGIAAGAYLLWKNWDAVKAWWGPFWDGLKSDPLSLLSTIAGLGTKTLDAFKAMFAPAVEWVKNTLNALWMKVWRHPLFPDKTSSTAPGPGGGSAGAGAPTLPGAAPAPASFTGSGGTAARGPAAASPSGGSGSYGGTPPASVLAKAREVAASGGPAAVQQFMASQGYPKSGAWCGQFAAAVVTSVGGTPPRNPSIASNWRNWGTPVDVPEKGDVAIRKGAATGSMGSHVTFVDSVDAKTGRFVGFGGNQGGRWQSNYATEDFEYRRGTAAPVDPATAAFRRKLENMGIGPTSGSASGITTGTGAPPSYLDQGATSPFGRTMINRGPNNHSSSIQNNIAELNVHTSATDGQGIAETIKPALERLAFAAPANYGLG